LTYASKLDETIVRVCQTHHVFQAAAQSFFAVSVEHGQGQGGGRVTPLISHGPWRAERAVACAAMRLCGA